MAIARWVFDRSIQKYLAGGFYDPDIVQVATALGRDPANCEIRERPDADPNPAPTDIYQVPDLRPSLNGIRTAIQNATDLAGLRIALLQLLQRVN